MNTFDQIVAARQRLADAIYLSPCAFSQTFSTATGLKVYFKLENLQMTGSFKERGALNRLSLMSAEARAAGVIAASAGNHAQGVAYNATKLGITSTIVMPETTPIIKVVSTRDFGAEVVLHGNNYDAACEEAVRRAEAGGLTLVHPFDDEAVIAGQGTIGLELLDQHPDLEAVVVPIGGGGLAGGVACALKEKKPSITVIGVEPERIASGAAALANGGPCTLDPAVTVADGIAVRRLGDLTYPLIARYVDEIVTVSEEELANGILLLLEREKTVSEGAGAAPLAAIVNQRTSLPLGKRTALVVSGGNIDVNLLSRIIDRGLAKDGRLLKLELKLTDSPGSLRDLIGVFAQLRANVLEVSHLRAFSGVDLGETIVDVTVETRGPNHAADIIATLRSARYELRRKMV